MCQNLVNCCVFIRILSQVLIRIFQPPGRGQRAAAVCSTNHMPIFFSPWQVNKNGGKGPNVHPDAQMTFENKRERIPGNLACSVVTAAARRSEAFSAGEPLHSFQPHVSMRAWSEVRARSQVRKERGPGRKWGSRSTSEPGNRDTMQLLAPGSCSSQTSWSSFCVHSS